MVQCCNLIDAIWRDDLEAVRELVTKHPKLLHENAGIRNDNWGPPMSYAANLGRNSIIKMLYDLGARDRNKLSEYLDAIRDIERRLEKAEQQNAEVKLPEMARPAGAPDNFEDHARLMIDLQAIAYQTDMTRVITFMFGRAGSNRPYRSIGISDGHHSLTHHMNDPEKIENAVSAVFDLRPAAIIRDLDLQRPIYAQTAAYGHFGREMPDFTWERTDRVDALRRAAGL